jgi:hypothetical protein
VTLETINWWTLWSLICTASLTQDASCLREGKRDFKDKTWVCGAYHFCCIELLGERRLDSTSGLLARLYVGVEAAAPSVRSFENVFDSGVAKIDGSWD